MAVGAFHDSRRVLMPEIRVSVCYQAGLQAAITLVRAAGYRLRSAPGGHHYVVFATVSALGSPELARAGEAMNRLRRRRHDAVYDWREQDDDGPDAEALETTVAEMITTGATFLSQLRPSLHSLLAQL